MAKTILLFFTICLGFFSPGQVPVKDEPHHHNVFENEHIRALDVHIGPKDTTGYHEHNTPSVFFTFSKTYTTSQLIGRQPSRSSISNPGPPSYDSLAIPRIHRVWNDDTTWFHVMDIELKNGKPKTNPPVLQNSLLSPSFNRYLANGYRLQLRTGDSIELPAPSQGYLLVSQVDADIQFRIGDTRQHRFMKPGHFIWIGSDNSFSLTNSGSPCIFMLLQLK